MNTAGLSLSDAPPFGRIHPFFIASAVFGALSFFALSFAATTDRYDPYIIASIHLFTIGFLLNTAFGALSQMLPVVGGVKIESPKVIRITQFGISAGAVLFFAGFAFYRPLLFAALPILCFSLLSGFGMLLLKIQTNKQLTSQTVKGVRFALIISLVAFALGGHLLFSQATMNIAASHLKFVDIHLTTAIFGFFGALVIAISHQVLPMFYVAPEFPKFCRVWPAVIFIASLSLFIPIEVVGMAAKVIIWTAMLAFGVVALKKLKERKRLMSDASLKLWQTGLVSLIVGLAVWALDSVFGVPHKEFLFALFFGVGFLGSIVKAMSNKIVPFLAWFHLTNSGKWDAPSVREMITDKSANIELYLHIGSMFLFLCSIFFPPLFAPASLIGMISFLVLGVNMAKTVKIYKNELTKAA